MTKYEAVKHNLTNRFGSDIRSIILEYVPYKITKRLKEEESKDPKRETLEVCSYIYNRHYRWVVARWIIATMLLVSGIGAIVFVTTESIDSSLFVAKTIAAFLILIIIALSVDICEVRKIIEGCYSITDGELADTDHIDIIEVISENFKTKYGVPNIRLYLSRQFIREHHYAPIEGLPDEKEVFNEVEKITLIRNPIARLVLLTVIIAEALFMYIKMAMCTSGIVLDLFSISFTLLLIIMTIAINTVIYVERKHILEIAKTPIN